MQRTLFKTGGDLLAGFYYCGSRQPHYQCFIAYRRVHQQIGVECFHQFCSRRQTWLTEEQVLWSQSQNAVMAGNRILCKRPCNRFIGGELIKPTTSVVAGLA